MLFVFCLQVLIVGNCIYCTIYVFHDLHFEIGLLQSHSQETYIFVVFSFFCGIIVPTSKELLKKSFPHEELFVDFCDEVFIMMLS